MLHLTATTNLKSFIHGEGMFCERHFFCHTCNTKMSFYDFCRPLCPGCYELAPPINDLFEGGVRQRIAYHLEKLL